MKAQPPSTRAGQREFERGVDQHRISAFLARRQYGKTTISSRVALKKMMRTAGHTVVFGSVKLDLGREIVRKEAAEIHKAIRTLASIAEGAQNLMSVVDGASGKNIETLGDDDFADIYESQRLEFRLYHSRSVYSRTKVVALTPDAVGETGDLILDEVGRVKKFREVWEAVKPIIASQPTFRCMLTTTPPPDDSHYSFELLAPPVGSEFPISPTGNWYRSELGVWVLRLDAWDAYADGVPLYDDDTGEPIDPDTARSREHDKEAWDRNYGVKFVLGGAAAVGLLQLQTAQTRGMGNCRCFVVEDEPGFLKALLWLNEKLGTGTVGLGLDLATTEKESSNPTSFTVLEDRGTEYAAVAVVVWKTRDPAIAKDRIRRLVAVIPQCGGQRPRARRLCIDATSERYFAIELQREMASLVPVELVIASETVEQPGGETITKKALLGSNYVAELDDNHVTLPPERYLRDDHRLVKRDRGSFVADIGTQGEHGDTFDSNKLALHALTSTQGAIESMAGIRVPRAAVRPRRLTARQFLGRAS